MQNIYCLFLFFFLLFFDKTSNFVTFLLSVSHHFLLYWSWWWCTAVLSLNLDWIKIQYCRAHPFSRCVPIFNMYLTVYYIAIKHVAVAFLMETATQTKRTTNILFVFCSEFTIRSLLQFYHHRVFAMYINIFKPIVLCGYYFVCFTGCWCCCSRSYC